MVDNPSGSEFRSVVFNAAKDGNLRRIQIFITPCRSREWLEACLNGCSEKNPLVIAARNGFTDIVRFLIANHADPNSCGTVTFEGEQINQSPPLWAAAAAGHMEVVKILVEEAGANVNKTTSTNSTPLRGACYDGHLDIVKYLVEHGADMEIGNSHGHTPLMIASFRNKIEVVKYLLSKDVEINKATKRGNSALHDAAEGDNPDICQLLIDEGALLMPDEHGLCPLMCAAMAGNEEVVKVLLTKCDSGVQRREIWKMVGCSRVDKKMDQPGACAAWKKALAVELTEEERLEVEKAAAWQVPSVYEGNHEVNTAEGIDDLLYTPDAVYMQALLIRERILGGANQEVHYYLRLRGAVYCDLGQLDRCYRLWIYALKLQQEYLSPLHIATLGMLKSFQETFVLTINDHIIHMDMNNRSMPVVPELVVEVFGKVCYELERRYDWGDRPLYEECCASEHDHDEHEDMQQLVFTGLQLLILINRLTLPINQIMESFRIDVDSIDDVGKESTQIDVKRLIKICRKVKVPLLHIAMSDLDPKSTLVARFPSLYVVKKLVEAGATVGQHDDDGNTPLHLVLKGIRPRLSVVRYLLDSGAQIHARNSDNETCMELLKKLQATSGNETLKALRPG